METDLRQTEVDGDSFRNVEKPAIAGEGEGEAIQGLQNVGPLMGLEQLQMQGGAGGAAVGWGGRHFVQWSAFSLIFFVIGL